MTRSEAILDMHNGKKLTHDSFTSEEWVTIKNGKFLFEDDCICSFRRFWETRQDDGWATGWSIFV